MKLREYQTEAVDRIYRGWEATHGTKLHRSQLVVLATGLGKTIVFAEIIRRELQSGKRALVLAHREELLDQAVEKISWIIPQASIGREQATQRATPMDSIVVASVASLGREGSSRLSDLDPESFGLVVIDEAHHAPASTYQNILNQLSHARVLGVTATPKRSDKESLYKIFDRCAYQMDIVAGTQSGYLVPIVGHRVGSTTDLSGIKTTAGDFNLRELSDRVNNSDRNSLILDTYIKKFLGRQAIIFATTVEHARAIETEFSQFGVPTACVSGDMDKQFRKEVVSSFKTGGIRVLTNYGVLTEGFDYPALDLIINARPTKSLLLLTQILGRCTRIHPEKKHADFVEIIDNHSEETATASMIFGFNQEFDGCGESFPACLELADQMEKEKPEFNPYEWSSLKQIKEKFESFEKERETQAAERKNHYFESRYRWWKWKGGIYFCKTKDKEGNKIHLSVQCDPLGVFSWHAFNKTSFCYIAQGKEPDLEKATCSAEVWLKNNRPELDILLNIHASWRKRAHNEPCTDKQFLYIEKYRLTQKPKEKITKAEAGQLLDQYFNRPR